MDKVIISDLLVRGIIGVNDWERKRAQDILINVTLFTDTRRAAETDSIVDCVNYSTMSKRLQAHAESVNRLTVEALANDLAKICFPGAYVGLHCQHALHHWPDPRQSADTQFSI